MKYIGIQSQIWQNNIKSILLLILFPAVLYGLVYVFLYLINYNSTIDNINQVNNHFLVTVPWITIGVVIWFIIAYFSHSFMIQKATGSRPLQRKENMRVYNLVENLCISVGMKMPKINIIEDDSLNAFASGINDKTYTISLSRGIINKLNDQELEAVIAHELTHIRNRDVRLLIVSIIFVGIFSFITEMLVRNLIYGGRGNNKRDGRIVIIALVLAIIGYFLALIFRFALSRRREYMADAGAAQMTRNPLALASALRKIVRDPTIEAVERQDVAQLFIEHPGLSSDKKKSLFGFIGNLFATHPPIQERIRILEQY